jgi:hypothetical protein
VEKNQNTGVNYEALERERAVKTMRDLRHKLKTVSEKDLGRSGSLRRVVLGLVVSENYPRAKEEVQLYVDVRVDFPRFQNRVQKYIKHAVDLVQAIQTKRNFPGLGSLALSKQQEINERVLTHFEELKQTLKRIERAERESKLSDLRGTSIIVTTIAHCLILLLIVGFAVAMSTGLAYSFNVVFDALVNDITRFVGDFLNI